MSNPASGNLVRACGEHVLWFVSKVRAMTVVAISPSAEPVPSAEHEPQWTVGLNERQRAAVDHASGPLLVLAGAGTGKTRTLVARLARLVNEGVAPERILLVTFSHRAAQELVRRTGHVLGAPTARRVHAGTFHATAHRLLRIYGSALGLADGFTVLDRSDTTDLLDLVRGDQGHGQRRRFAKKATLASIYSRTVNTQRPLAEVLGQWFPWCAGDAEAIGAVFTGYTERKRMNDALDFDDLLLFWRAAATTSLGPVLASRYDHVLVDEYQDTNVLQSDILRALRSGEGNGNITVVGDDAQSIYSFRAATVRNILDFDEHFPSATIVALEQNYRSTKPILDLANAVLADADEGTGKHLWTSTPGGSRPVLATCPDERAQSDAVCDTVLAHFEQGVALREQAVLFRAAHHSDALEVELRRRNVPFVKYGGLKFLEAAHVRDLLALLRVLDNPWDELAWFRVLQLAEGVGPATATKLIADLGVQPRVGSATDSPLTKMMSWKTTATAPPGPRSAASELRALAEALGDCADERVDVATQVERLRRTLEPVLVRRYDNAEVRLRDLDALARIATEYSSRRDVVAELTLDPPTSTGDLAGTPLLDDDYLVLTTVHSAKGCEWPVVHVIHAADGNFPSDMATGDAEGIDEERRLFYVALTRAQHHLHLYTPLRYHHEGAGSMGDRHSWAQRTRFLPPTVDHLLDHRAVRTPHVDRPEDVPGVGALTISVDQTLQDLW